MSSLKTASEEVVVISRLDLESIPAEATITNVKHLASYNWIEASTPTIAVPGSPARWSPLREPQQLKKDSGKIYIAQNAARHPDSPLEPLFRSLYIEQPSFDINPIDIVTDRNNIRKLLSFIQPKIVKRDLESFTIQVEMAAQTAIFCRDETATSEWIAPNEFKGFGHEFEKSYTVSQVKDSTGHHRIVQYQLGGLNFLVRHETDGYIEEKVTGPKNPVTQDKLTSMLESLSLSPATVPTNEDVAQSKLAIKKEGRVVPRESTLEIKTRVFHRPLEFSDFAPQLWVSQTPKLVRAYHQRGVFSTPEVEDVSVVLKVWEKCHQEDIKKLIALLNRVISVTRNWSGSSTLQYDSSTDKLFVKKVARKKMLPDDLYSRWKDSTSANTEHMITEACPVVDKKGI